MAVLATALLAACGGGSGAPPVLFASHSGTGTAAFSVQVPSSTASPQARPQYVSPNAATMQIAITPADAGGTRVQQTVDLAGTACTANSSGRTCSVTISLAPGQYSASISMFAATGAVLSQGQNLAFTVSGGQTTPVDLTLNGVPGSFQLSSTPTMSGSLASGFSITQATTISVQTIDASGATIVGPGSPSVSLTSNNGVFAIASGSSPGTYTITPPGASLTDSTATITLSATFPGAAQPALSKQFALKKHTPLLFVSNTGTNTIVGYFLPYTVNADPAVTITDGVNTPLGMATDSAGNLFTAELSASNISEHAPPYTGSAVIFGDQDLGNNVLLGPFNVAVDKSGTVYGGSLFTNYVLSYAPPFSRNSVPVTEFDAGRAPLTLAIDGSGDVLTSNWDDGSISLFKPPFSSRVSPAASLKNPVNSNVLVSVPWQMAFDRSGTLWVEWFAGGNTENTARALRTQHHFVRKQGVSLFGSMLTGYTPPFTNGQPPSVVINAGMTEPEGLAVNTNPGPYDGYVFVSNFDTNTVTMFAPPITSASVGTPLPGSFGGPIALCLDAGGNLYVANASANTISIYAPPYTDPKNPVATIMNGIAAPFALTVTP